MLTVHTISRYVASISELGWTGWIETVTTGWGTRGDMNYTSSVIPHHITLTDHTVWTY